ncbi:MAG: hypothetical protein RSB05_07865 [Clostridiales bacterium]
MKKFIGILLGVLALCVSVAAFIYVFNDKECCPCKKVKEFFTEKDFTVLPMEEDAEV